ncbi:MAG TPA: glycolate oxidase subunit GlcF [Steroidobacteraceae bacterium]|nr:glycolate oxidase subunit GlcF [Steroidobacteraceae bacterium]
MQTRLSAALLDTPDGREADGILRKCVHCGFCTATCPTYQLLGDELDGPRGRIYLIKEMLEGASPSRATQLHLDRCLTCRACETTCPSGVRYGRLLDIGRHRVEQVVPRTLRERIFRRALLATIPRRKRFTALLALGRMLRPLMPARLRHSVPVKQRAGAWPAPRHARRMLVLAGCVQPGVAPDINAAAARVLDRLGITLIEADDGCCGALAYHLAEARSAREQMRRNIDAWWPDIERGAEALVVTASGCGAMIRDYGELLRDDPAYAHKAARVAELFRDIGQVVAQELAKPGARLEPTSPAGRGQRVAFHAPCTLQHGLKLRGIIEPLLEQAGYTLTSVPDAHLCCGSAGSYSLLQPAISRQLKANKLAALQADTPDVIATANVGCLMHLASGAERPVRHWIELLGSAMAHEDARSTK